MALGLSALGLGHGCHFAHRSAAGSPVQPYSRTYESTARSARRSCHRLRRSVVIRADAAAQEVNILVADIGGTNARLSLWRTSSPSDSKELFHKTYPTEGNTPNGVVKDFLQLSAASGGPPVAAGLAVAGVVEGNRCDMTNCKWVVDGEQLQSQFGFRVGLLNDFEAVGYGVPLMSPQHDMAVINKGVHQPKAPIAVIGPGTGLGAAQLTWDDSQQEYKVWPGEGSHASFAPRGWKQRALAAYAESKLEGHVEIEQVACGSGLELIYEFLCSDELANRPGLRLDTSTKKSAKVIGDAALAEGDPLAEEAADMMMAIVGAEAGAMALRMLARGGVYVAGGITPKQLPRLRRSATGGGALLEGFLCRKLRKEFQTKLAAIPLVVITNEKRQRARFTGGPDWGVGVRSEVAVASGPPRNPPPSVTSLLGRGEARRRVADRRRNVSVSLLLLA
ncbi:hypothetical protein QJQ45_028840 [Haematococcus lacustris]|nr:hypothetical protein QJQ45_028840 [Haematococcus lacustris]